jgi:DNA-binding response OmpR family regulator
LIVGDEDERMRLRRALSGEGWRVLPAGTGKHARRLADEENFDVVVAENRLPDERGFQVISAVGKAGSVTISLLRDEDTMERIVGMELGSEYYMSYPVNPRELVARIQQIFRRKDVPVEEGIRVRDLEIDPVSITVHKEGEEISLSPREFQVLYTLARRPGKVFSRGNLLREVWGEEEYIDKKTVNVCVRRLRTKLGDQQIIETVRGFGYRLNPGVG